MRNHSAVLPDSRTGPMAASWLASCLLHGGLAVTAMFFVQRMHLAPQADPFQWNVAMVATLSPSVKAASQAQPTPPPTLTHRQSALPTKSANSTVRQAQPTKASPIDSPSPIPTAELTPKPQQLQPVLNESSVTDSRPIVTAHSSSQPTSPHLLVPLPEQAPQTQNESSSLAASQSVTDSSLDPVPSTNVASASADPQKLAKVDYGWLAALMAQWIEGLDKRYPATLRTEGIQGKVMLTAMLHEDGTLSDVRVVRSSGNPTLDQVALEDVRNGPPVKLSRSLERSQMSVKFSISYDLKMAR